MRVTTDTNNFEITDHLGNVRAIIIKNGTNAVSLTAKTDYYPFGMPMPNRDLVGDYRYKYQGQEKDPETGKEAFELRLWDGRIGRWLTIDPYNQYFSPYMGMDNNPISSIDPDGGMSCPDPPCNDLPIGATPLIGEGGFVSDNPIGVQVLDEVVVTGYNPVDLKGGNQRAIFDGLINNIIQFQLDLNENTVAGKRINGRPRVTDFVVSNLNIVEQSIKFLEKEYTIDNSIVYIQARFQNARTRPRKPEPEIVGWWTKAKKRGTITHNVYAFEILLYSEGYSKSGHQRTYDPKPTQITIGFYDRGVFDKYFNKIQNETYKID